MFFETGRNDHHDVHVRNARMHRPAARSSRCATPAPCGRKGRACRGVDQGHPRSQGQELARRYPLSLSQPGGGRQGRPPESGAVRAFRHVRQRADPRGQRQADPRPGAKAHDDRDAPRGHGSHGHRHAGRVARAEPVLLLDRPGAGRRTVAHGERPARRDRGELAGALRRARNRAAAARRSRGRRARALREAARPARRGNQPQRQRHGPHGPAAEPGEVLRQGAGARRRHLHASDRLHAGRASASTITSTT